MDVQVIIGLVVLLGIGWLLVSARDLFWKKTNQKVLMRGAHREGEQLVSQRLVFTAGASVDQVRNAILSTVKVAPSVPPVLADAHLIGTTTNEILYGYGNKLQPNSFRALLRLQSTSTGTEGSWEVLNWHRADGIVVGRSVMKRLIADIDTALQSVDPNASLR